MRRRATAGLTLLELMLAMAVLAMVSGICYSAFFVAIRAVNRGEIAVVTAGRLRVATDVLIRQIKSAVPYAARNEDEEVYPFFEGSTAAMTFITANARVGGPGLSRVRYQLTEDPPELVLEEDVHFGPDALGRPPEDTGGSRSAVLLTGFETLSFEYLLDDGVDTEWLNQWDGYEEDMLPAAIRITVYGLPGLEHDVWGQEIPIMVASYAEGNGEVDESDIPEDDQVDELDDESDDDFDAEEPDA